MKKSDFLSLVLGVVGGLLFSIGMCMCLLPEWNVFTEGVYAVGAGIIVLIILAATRIKGSAAPAKKIDWALVGKVVFGILGTLVLGVGMCMILVWNMMLWGIVVGVAGIVMLLCLIPMFVGLK